MLYLDNNATTQPDPRVVEALLPFLRGHYGNAASRSHAFGWTAEAAVETARKQVADLIGADPREIVWTSGATEADNLALKGIAEASAAQGDHLVTVATEHKAVLDTAQYLETQGKRVTVLPVDEYGLVDLDQLRDSLTDRTVLVSVMLGNNEIGTIQPIAEIGKLCRERGILFHTDATQGVGKLPLDLSALPVDLLSLSAHKIHGPKGVGALFVRRRRPQVRVAAQMHGGGHERGMRSGTLNVPGIVGFGAAAALCQESLTAEAIRLQCLRDRLHHGLQDQIQGILLNGHPALRLPGTVNLCFAGVDADALQVALPQIAVSTGSACSSAAITPSHVLTAIGRTPAQARSSVRFSLSRETTEAEIDQVIDAFAREVSRLRALTLGGRLPQ